MSARARTTAQTPARRALHLARRVLVAALILAVVITLYLFVLTRGAIV